MCNYSQNYTFWPSTIPIIWRIVMQMSCSKSYERLYAKMKRAFVGLWQCFHWIGHQFLSYFYLRHLIVGWTAQKLVPITVLNIVLAAVMPPVDIHWKYSIYDRGSCRLMLIKSILLADSFLLCLYSMPSNYVRCRFFSTYIHTFSQILGWIENYCENLFLSVGGRILFFCTHCKYP